MNIINSLDFCNGAFSYLIQMYFIIAIYITVTWVIVKLSLVMSDWKVMYVVNELFGFRCSGNRHMVYWQGNHGEDVKELFYYVDGLPDHSYMKALYRYPQNEFPYEELLQRNLERNQQDPEFELTDTGCTLIRVYIFFLKFTSEELVIIMKWIPLFNLWFYFCLQRNIWWRWVLWCGGGVWKGPCQWEESGVLLLSHQPFQSVGKNHCSSTVLASWGNHTK